ncbi:patatin-like phospholipase family protein [Ferrimonas senticii]|uniref:patatin-like phospholipase family protein n=1 Tax=Ferrimonas senticii TaxID=394566 RepID=UPI00068749AB|nr:patatin-like phospholipase family protein [Ferrimonas senticii]
MMIRWLFLLLLGFSTLAVAATPQRLKVGVALSGGGAKGAAHVGVLRVLEQNQIPVDYIAGTSMGAYVATLYAAGYSPEQIERRLTIFDFASGFSDEVPRSDLDLRNKRHRDDYPIELKVGFEDNKLKFAKGALEGQTMASLLRRSIGNIAEVKDFDTLPIPLRTVATSLSDRAEVRIDSGDLVTAMQASMAVPGALAPVKWQGQQLADGGLVNNMPVQVVRDMGADVVIAVDIGSPLLSEDQLNSVFDVLDQLTNYLTNLSRDQQVALMQPQDLLIVPNIEGVGTSDFEQMPLMIARGEEAMRGQVGKLSAVAISGDDYWAYQQQRQTAHQQLVAGASPLVAVRLNNQSWVKDRVIMEALRLEPGDNPTALQIDNAVDRVYAINDFAQVDAALKDGDHGRELVITTKGKDWGPNVFDLGLRFEDNFQDVAQWELGIALTSNNVGPLDGQWRNAINLGTRRTFSSDYYQPLEQLRRIYAFGRFEFEQRDWDTFTVDGSSRLGLLEQQRLTTAAGLGWNIGSSAQLELSYLYEDGNYKERFSSIGQPQSADYWKRAVELKFTSDDLDRRYFPTEGALWEFGVSQVSGQNQNLMVSSNNTGLASDIEQWVYHGRWLGASHIGRHNFFAKAEALVSEEDDLTLAQYTTAGGFFNLSGFHRDALYGNHKVLAGIGYHYDFGLSDATGNAPLFVGFTFEAGNVWLNRDDISADELIYAGSIFAGAETGIGTVSLGLGSNDRDQSSVYLVLGQIFE